MAINLEKVQEIYGIEVLEHLKDEYQYEQFEQNIIYLKHKGIEALEEVIERYYLIFLSEHEEFKNKVEKLLEKLGKNYIEILGEDMSYWEELM